MRRDYLGRRLQVLEAELKIEDSKTAQQKLLASLTTDQLEKLKAALDGSADRHPGETLLQAAKRVLGAEVLEKRQPGPQTDP